MASLSMPPDPRQPQAFALATIDRWRWLLPQTEVASLESPSDIDPEVRAPQSLGAIAFANEWWPVYGLSGELHPLAQLPEYRRFCLLLNNGADRFGLVCDEVDTLASIPQSTPLPACMAIPGTPILGLILLGAELGCITNTERLAAWLAAFMDRADG